MTKYLKRQLTPVALPVATNEVATSSVATTPQSEPMRGTAQVANSAGGYAWAVNDWTRLRRFLILGSEGGSYYVTERALTAENANTVLRCIASDGVRAVQEIATISEAGRAPKNDPAIFALALAASRGDETTRRAALAALPQVCRTGTHLFHFVDYVQAGRGWGRGLRRAIAAWYAERAPRELAYQLVKYRQRGGWTHTDLLRLAHPRPDVETRSTLYRYVTHPDQAAWAQSLLPPDDEVLAFIWAFERAQRETDAGRLAELIEKFALPWEALPTAALRELLVWRALLPKMPITALLRNLGTMSKVEALSPFSPAEKQVVERLTSAEALKRGRVHPIAVLTALRVYSGGHGVRGGGEWYPSPRVVDALDQAFYLAFDAVEPAGVRILLAMDVSGSMGMGNIAGVPGLTPREASAALALVTARTEPQYDIISFQSEMVPLDISASMRLSDAVTAVSNLAFGRTDCAQPMLYALERKLEVDAFVIYTDSETWAGKIHPTEALRRYRQKTGIPARLIVVGMVSNGFSIADPDDGGMLDVVGFDSATPGLIADFARGTI